MPSAWFCPPHDTLSAPFPFIIPCAKGPDKQNFYLFLLTLDIKEKRLEEHADVFADIVNGLLFQGQHLIMPTDLQDAVALSDYRMPGGPLHEQERDVVKYFHRGSVRIAMVGFENQTAPDKDMPLRIISYDGAAYRSELNADE